MPALAAVRAMDRTYQAAPSSSVGTTTASVGVMFRSRSSAADDAVRSRLAAAMALPSMMRLIARPACRRLVDSLVRRWSRLVPLLLSEGLLGHDPLSC